MGDVQNPSWPIAQQPVADVAVAVPIEKKKKKKKPTATVGQPVKVEQAVKPLDILVPPKGRM